MDVIDINQAARKAVKMLSDNGLIGKTEYKEGHYSYNGDSTDKVVLNGVEIGVSDDATVNYVKISEDVIRADMISKIATHIDNIPPNRHTNGTSNYR